VPTETTNPSESALNLAYFAVAISFFVTGATCSSWLARIPPIQEHLGIGAGLLGVVFLVLSLGSLAGMKLAGKLATKCGSKQLIVWATALMCLALPVPGFASNFVVLCLSIFFFGICLGTINILMNTLAVELEHQLNRPVMSSLHGLHSVGTMIGAIIGSLMSIAHVVPALHFSVTAVIIAFTIPLSKKWLVAITEDQEKKPEADNISRITASLTPYLMALALIAFCSCWSEGIMADWSAVYFRSELHTSHEAAPNGFVGFCITMSVGRLLGDWLLKRLGPTLLVRGGGCVALAGLILSLASTSVWLAVAGFSLIGLGLANIVPIVFRAAGNAPNTNASESLATVAALSYFAFLIGPPIVGWVAQYFGLRIALAIALPLLFLITLFANATKLLPTEIVVEEKAPIA
jgi:MFS family permease